eukprot:GEMP01072598.1.p1 GENE.GEMP01072598.1~~GEMP01072598.1.p1  ORF type:complete len:208 (+),score=37.05 GEMP01072598.1:32-625(+)
MPKPCNTQHIFLTHSQQSAEKERERRLFTNSTRGLHNQSRSRSPWIRGGASGRGGEDFLKTRQSAEAWGVAPRGNQRRQNLVRNNNADWTPWARQKDDRRGGKKGNDDKKAVNTMKTMSKGKGRGERKGKGKGKGASKSEGKVEVDLDFELDKYFDRKTDDKLDKQLDEYFAEKKVVITETPSKKTENEEKPEEKAD